MEFFKKVVSVPNTSKTALAWNFDAFHRSELWVALITFLYLDFLDATGARERGAPGPRSGPSDGVPRGGCPCAKMRFCAWEAPRLGVCCVRCQCGAGGGGRLPPQRAVGDGAGWR